MAQTTRNSRIIKASAETLYQALTTPEALEVWQAPNDMTGRVHSFDLREGGGYQMSLFYPEYQSEMSGKTMAREDRFTTKFVELKPAHKIVETVVFETDDPQFSGQMTIEITMEPVDESTNVTFLFTNIPVGIKPEDNEAGTISSLEKLALYVE